MASPHDGRAIAALGRILDHGRGEGKEEGRGEARGERGERGERSERGERGERGKDTCSASRYCYGGWRVGGGGGGYMSVVEAEEAAEALIAICRSAVGAEVDGAACKDDGEPYSDPEID